ncbi:DUF1775 domain-containing protein [Streptomyces malaysiensis]|uniref:YncI copper-binding domain-containing protein n=1 Tax=Streptomyces malaysiensis TaxID=92644 RepID=A0A2J7YNL3_STRMQ|nr:DUF1775 domain-containing protein [Streptomyces malaysiensis]PNG89617.1 hypothetical protein SMF913_25082 [Streptomyces malaysiensis]
MSRITLPRAARRLAIAAAASATAVVLTAVPAAAHVEVESEKAEALAEHVTISFEAESESDSAGITELKVVLPEGIKPADVTYDKGPEGWKFAAEDAGYTVKGPALKAGENAEYSITVRQLPDAKELAFKTLQTYGDKRTDRWIELDDEGENPAPVLKLEAAAPGAKQTDPSPSNTASPTPTADDTAQPSSAKETDEKSDQGGLPAGAWVGIGAAVVIAIAAVFFVVRRRGGARS